jgi:hypothetical protein
MAFIDFDFVRRPHLCWRATRGCFAARLNVEGNFLLLAVDFANHRHPFFDLNRHAQIGAARVHWIAHRIWCGTSRIKDTLGHDTLGHGLLGSESRFACAAKFLFRRNRLSTSALPLMDEPLAK